MPTQAKIVIKGENNIGKAVQSAQKDISSLKDTVSNLGTMLKSAISALAIQKIASAAKQCFNEFETARLAYKQLAVTIGDQQSYDNLVTKIGELATITLEGKDGVEAIVAELSALGKSETDIEKISEAAVNLSNVTGQSLNSAMTTLLKTYEGNTTQLQRMGISLGDLSKEEFSAGAAADVINEKWGELSRTMASNNMSQTFKNLSDMLGDIKQYIGGIIEYNIAPFMARISGGMTAFYENVTNIATYIGAVINKFPDVARIALKTIFNMVKKTFEWSSIKSIFTALIKSIFVLITTALKELVINLPSILWNGVVGIIEYIKYIGTNLYGEILAALEKAFGAFGTLAKDTWIGKAWSKLGGDTSQWGQVDFGSQRVFGSANTYLSNANTAFGNAGGAVMDAINTAINGASGFVSTLSDAFLDVYGDTINAGKDEIAAIIGPVMKDLAVVAEASAQEVLSLGGTTGTVSSGGGASGDDPTLLERFVDAIKGGDLINKFISLADPLTYIVQAFNGLMEVLGPSITNILNPIFNVLTAIGKLCGTLILPAFEYVGAVISWLGDWICFIIDGIATAWYNLTHVKNKAYSAAPSSLADHYNNIVASGSNTSTSTALSSASYQGATSVTINIYQQSPVVGDNGMRAFAAMIRDEFDSLNYFGVTT